MLAVIHNHPIHYKHLLFKAMTAAKLDFEVLFVCDRSSARIEPIALTQDAYRYRVGELGPYENHSRVRAITYVWRSLSKLRPNVVIISGCYDVAGWTAWVWANVNRKKRIIWNEINVFDRPRRWHKELLKRIFVCRCHYAHVYGKTNKEYLVRLGMEPDHIEIKRAVANTQLFRTIPGRSAQDSGPLDFLFVGRFSPEKNLRALILAMSTIQQDRGRPRAVLSLVGYGPQEQELKALAQDLGMETVVRFEGALLQQRLPERYNGAHVFVLPSLREPWGLVALEAMLCGLPAIISSQCGCAADLVNERTGWTFSPFSDQELPSLLERVISLPRESIRDMGLVAAELGREYSPEACAAIVARNVSEALQQE